MKYFFSFVILFCAFGSATAQNPRKWTRLHGPNVGYDGGKLYWGADGEIISLNNSRGYNYSTDDGKTWNFRTIVPVQTPLTNESTSYVFFGMNILSSGEYFFYLGSTNGSPSSDPAAGVYHSTDFGNTWTQLLQKKDVWNLEIASDNSLIINANGETYKSIDKGKSWVQLSNTNGIGNMILAATSTYFLFSRGYGLEKYDFASQNVSFDTAGIPYLASVNIRGGFLIDESHILLWTDSLIFFSDGVNPWRQVGSLQRIQSITTGPNNTLLTEVNTGNYQYSILSSSDVGKSWDTILTIPQNLYIEFHNFFNTDKLLYGNSTALYLSTDHASSWQEIGYPNAWIDQVKVSDVGNIFATIQGHSVTGSTDHGEKWQLSNIYSLYFLGKGLSDTIIGVDQQDGVYIVQADTFKLRSIIEHLDYNFTKSIHLASDHQKYIYLSDNTTIYRSDDNAVSWLDINAPDDGDFIYSMDVANNGTLYFGTRPVIYRSDDKGGTWTRLLPFPDPDEITCIKAIGASDVFIGSNGKGLLHSSDKGNSWTRIDGNNFDFVNCIAIDNKGSIAAGTPSGLWIFDNFNQTWSKISLGGVDTLYIGGIDVAANDDFYVGTFGSSLWMGTRNYNAVGESHNTNSSMTIFPNPASEKITIDLNVPDQEEARVELYDVLGRKISVLADGKFFGEKKINFNTSNLSDGLYTVSLVSNGREEIQKLVVAH